MSTYEAIFTAATHLPVDEQLRLIDQLASSVPDDRPPTLSDEWLEEIDRRSAEVDSGSVTTETWESVRERLFDRFGAKGEN